MPFFTIAEKEDLEKLFEAALHGKSAPSRFGTPEEQKKSAPAAFRRPAPAAAVKENAPGKLSGSFPLEEVPEAKAEPAVRRDMQGEASLDNTVNAELAAIMDEKVAKGKSRRRRGFVITLLFFLGVAGGAIGWVVSNPDRLEALKSAMAEVKSVGDVKGMVGRYQKALDKVAVRSQQIDAATSAMGVDPASVDEGKGQGFEKEMQEMMGEDGGKTTAERDKILREKFKSVQESGSLVPKKEGEGQPAAD